MKQQTTEWLWNKIRETTKHENDFNIVVSGFPGSGKSTLNLQIMYHKIGGGLFMPDTMDKHLLFSRGKMSEFLEQNDQNQIRNVDEAINLFYKRDFNNPMQKKLIKKLNRYRYKRHIIFLTIPNFSDLDLSIRAMNLIKFWIHVEKPGTAWVYKQIENEFCSDYWNINNNKKALMHKGKGRWQLRNTVACITWKPLCDRFHNVYKEIKRKRSAEAELEIEEQNRISQKDVILAIIENLNKKNREIDVIQLHRATGFDKGVIYNVRKEWSERKAVQSDLEVYI